MNNRFIKKLLITLTLMLSGFMTLPAQAWPEVDGMNMCDAPVKVARQYVGVFRGWQAHDNYVDYRIKADYYMRNNCPSIKAGGSVDKKIVKPQHNALYKKSQALYVQKTQ